MLFVQESEKSTVKFSIIPASKANPLGCVLTGRSFVKDEQDAVKFSVFVDNTTEEADSRLEYQGKDHMRDLEGEMIHAFMAAGEVARNLANLMNNVMNTKRVGRLIANALEKSDVEEAVLIAMMAPELTEQDFSLLADVIHYDKPSHDPVENVLHQRLQALQQQMVV